MKPSSASKSGRRRPRKAPRGPGHTRVPRRVWDDPNLSPELVGLLTYFASHGKTWVFRRAVFLPEIGMSEDKFDKLRRKMERLGYLKKAIVYRDGKVDCVRFAVDWRPLIEPLDPECQGSERKADPVKPAPGNSGEIRRVIERNAMSDVFEDEDVVPLASTGGAEMDCTRPARPFQHLLRKWRTRFNPLSQVKFPTWQVAPSLVALVTACVGNQSVRLSKTFWVTNPVAREGMNMRLGLPSTWK